jgi:sec-independent protein translocase protein TatC
MSRQTDPKQKGTKDAAKDTATMSFGDHLEDLRYRVIFSIVGIFPIFALSLLVSRGVLEFLLVPLRAQLKAADLPQIIQATGPIESFGAYVRVAFALTILVGGPWIMWQFWLFVKPGLHHHEERFAYLLLPMSVVLSISGITFLYFVLLPVVLAFFIGFGSTLGRSEAAVAPLPAGVVLPIAPILKADPESPEEGSFWINESLRELRFAVRITEKEHLILGSPLTNNSGISQFYRVSEYAKLLFQLAIAFSIGFQTPIVVMLLAWSGLVSVAYMASKRKYVVLICAVAGAVLTPADPLSMILMAVPLYFLYELGMLLAKYLTPSRVAGTRSDDTHGAD